MKSNIKKIAVYDFETGGLKNGVNNITEIAIVVIDMETLKIIDKYNSLILPKMFLNHIDADPRKAAKDLFKSLGEKHPDTGIKTLKFGEKSIGPHDVNLLEAHIEAFVKYLNPLDNILTLADYAHLPKELKAIAKAYYNYTYTPEALSLTGISSEMIIKKGVPEEVVMAEVKAFLEKHTEGNCRPVLAGHNIKKFDNPFFHTICDRNGMSLDKMVNLPQCVDTIELAKFMWTELENYTLGSCANALGIVLEGAHRALADTNVNAEVLVKMYKNLRGYGESSPNSGELSKRVFKFNF